MPAGIDFRVFVAHWPDYFPPASRAGFNLVLAGDTHGGQIRLPLVGAPVRKTTMPSRYAYGLVREGGATLYTTSGIGTRGVPLRLLCPPEIVVLELHCDNADAPTRP
jgi:predicted MPP superfamily phosphohydrolase